VLVVRYFGGVCWVVGRIKAYDEDLIAVVKYIKKYWNIHKGRK
jgi:hypothetical protein